MRKIDIEPFGEGQQIWFNIGRLRKVEEDLKQPLGDIIQENDKLSIKVILALLKVGMSQYGNKSEQYYAEKIDAALEEGYSIADIRLPVVKAVAASGILGSAYYYSLFPEELTKDAASKIEKEKN